MENKVLITVMMLLLLVVTVSAETKTYTLGESTDIQVVCINEGYCSASSYCNINIIAPDNGTRIVDGENMTNQISVHNYTITPQEVGTYKVGGFCIDGTYSKEIDFSFIVTKTGNIMSTSESILYILLSIAVFVLFLLSFYLMIITPYANKTNKEGAVIKITKLKYVKIMLISFCYIFMVVFLNLLVGLSTNYATLTIFFGIISFLFTILINLTYPVAIFLIILAVFEVIRDADLYENIKLLGEAATGK